MKMKIFNSLIDKIVNTFLFLKSYIRYILKIKKFGNEEPNIDEMSLVFTDDFSFFDNKNWRIGQPWGSFHPEFPNEFIEAINSL